MFESIQPAPADPILGLTEAFKADPNPQKINLGVGVYQDSTGKTPALSCVRKAGELLARSDAGSSYLPIPGLAEYTSAVQQLAFGSAHEVVTSGRAFSAQTPGGTGALRVVGDFLAANMPGTTLWVTDPTWANHANIFSAAGVSLAKFPYFDKANNSLALADMLDALQKIPAGDAVLLHGCCHNPTGVDPTQEQWEKIADVLYAQQLLPVLDFAYQGFGDGIDEDAVGLRTVARQGEEFILCSSFSKNFGLYNQRVGAATFVATDAERANVVGSQVKRAIRANYSNPPAHGARLVAAVLGDDDLRSEWHTELTAMRNRINGMRSLLVDKLAEKSVPGDYSFIKAQRGMFSFSGLTKEQVLALRERHAIYIVDSGRINVAGITESNVDRLTEAIADVVGG
ncbi:aspartate/tyrosine/aromatic aminotransferase [Aeoliella sp. ICT_H6.2]|uniref:Aminotransferase n=1 Tax=Aeoliella straminimaris TaxID=2954799 RepID=A0A9X2FIB4_9BACT|nr:amino acid aminotransferase [Aeoliella straminimaris]MCO6045766.1 aspartate/tyrosine/aromatic aminotransferase [Aeoliella straminimaris]